MFRCEVALSRRGLKLEAATESVKKSTGMDRPLAAVMNSKDVATLNKVAEDMARAARAEDIGRAIGSNTAQNLAAQNLLRRMLGPMGMKQSWAESNVLQGILSPYSVLAKYGGADSALMERLAKAALDPQDAAGLLSMEATRRPITPMLLPVARTGLLGYAAE